MIQYVYIPYEIDSDKNVQAKKRTFVCKNCHTVIVSASQQSPIGCPTATKRHVWCTFSTLGINPKNWVCKNCGLRIRSSISPVTSTIGSCVFGKEHSFTQA
jgi:transcription elongation factor Elf1